MTLCRYETLLRDCHQCYISQRGLLLTPIVSATIEELKKVHGTDNSGLVWQLMSVEEIFNTILLVAMEDNYVYVSVVVYGLSTYILTSLLMNLHVIN